MARLVVAAAVGIAVGVFSENPVYGLQAFTAVYGVTGSLDPNSKVLGPKLNDLKAPQASYGAPISYIEGAPRLAGNYIYASDKREIANTTTEGKGGPGVDSTTFTYEMDVFIEFAINECARVRRVWSNGRLVWTNADDADDESLSASASTTVWREMRFYNGNSAQLPDPTYEAAVGIGNAPAYRGRTCIFIEGLNLGQSGQLPILTFEILSEAEDQVSVAEFTRLEQERYYIGGIPAMSLSGFDMVTGVYDPTAGVEAVVRIDVYTIASDGSATLHHSITPEGRPKLSASGNSDVSCYVICENGANLYSCFYSTSYLVSCIFDCSMLTVGGAGNDQLRFSKVGDDVVIGVAGNAYFDKLTRFNAFTGALVITGDALPQSETSHAIGGAFVYALGADNLTIYVLDLATLTIVDTIATPVTLTGGGAVFCDSSGLLYFMSRSGTPVPASTGNNGAAWTWNGSTWDLVALGLEEVATEPFLKSAAYSVDGGVILSQRWESAGSSGNAIVSYQVTRTAVVLPTLDQVVRRLCLRTGLLTDDDIDVTDLSHDVAIADGFVRAMAVSQVGTTRVTLESLMAGYLFGAVEAETLRFVRRGGDSVLTIPYQDLAAGKDGTDEPIPRQRQNDIELPAFVTVKYANVLNDFQDGAESGDRLTTPSTAVAVVEVPFGFTPAEAKKLADANTVDLQVSINGLGPIALSRYYSMLEPTDVVLVEDGIGNTFRGRVTKGTIGAGTVTLELVLDDATVVNSAALTDDDYVSSTLIRVLANTDLRMLDIPILRDADNHLGPYAAVKATDPWAGAQIDRSIDNTAYSKVATVTDRTVIGTASSILPDFTGGGVFDMMSSVDVDVGDDVLSSYSIADALAGTAAAYLIGSEIVYALTATPVTTGPNVYTLTGFLRGLRGTEWAIPGHAANEIFVLLQVAGMRKISDENADLNATRYFKAVTLGKSISAVPGKVFVDTGVALKPFAPVDVAYDTATGEFTWDRRSRLSGLLFGGDPVLGEATEAYDYELLDASDVVQASGTLTEPRYVSSGFAAGDVIEPSIWGMKSISGTLVAIRQEAPQLAISNPSTSAESILTLNPDGTIADQSTVMGNVVTSWVGTAGGVIYTVAQDFTHTVPMLYGTTRIQRRSVGSISTLGTSQLSGVDGDSVGIAFDGTDVWVSEQLSNEVRRRDATTLILIAAYVMVGSPGPMQYDSGKLYVVAQGTGELVRFDTTSHTEDYRISSPGAADVLLLGGVVFVLSATAVSAYTAATGALLATVTISPGSYLPGRQMTAFGSGIAVATTTRVVFIDGTTGLQTNSAGNPVSVLDYAAGSDGTDLYLTGRAGSGFSEQTRKYTVAPPMLAGYSLTVWQRSSVVGRGYPVTLDL